MKESRFLAFDLGASSGRAVIGSLRNGKLLLEEIYRFKNESIELNGSLYWNFLSLWSNVCESLKICPQKGYNKLDGIGIDTWAVDFALLNEGGKIIREPLCYRDSCTEGMDRFINTRISQREIYNITGFTVSRVGSLQQLASLKKRNEISTLKKAKSFLMMPDLFRYFLGGSMCAERTIAGSSLIYNIRKNRWSNKILKTFDFPKKIFPKIIESGTITGKLKKDLARKYSLDQAPIIAVAEHDTPSAFAACPYSDDETIVISCGTWSVLGQSVDKPILTNEAFRSGFVNEAGFKSILFVKNMMGLYLFENLKRELESKGNKIAYSKMVALAQKAKPFKSFLDTNAPMLFAGSEPLELIKKYFKKTGQKAVDTESVIRILLEGLAFSYRSSVEKIKSITGKNYKRICMVGGGVKNSLLCQMTAGATGLKVIAGPAEATVAGNLAIQALASGQLSNFSQIKEIVRNSFEIKTYSPQDTNLWDKKYISYKAIENKSIKLK